ncbi:MAG TPA: hypothetical protein VFK85_07075 [Anaeromyxobacteraceae bacterium]|nr:hypothetical protein [Anaeromyxobacteraceae bacterium]
MRPISTRELRWLLGDHVAPCISIYLPADRHADAAADLRRFSARIGEAAELLGKAMRPEDVTELLEPVRQLRTARFWGGRVDALAVFRSGDVFTHYRIPAQVPELTVVADTFHSRPLIRYLNSNRRQFYVLALAADAVTLLEGTLDRLARVDPEDLPPELREALHLEDAPQLAAEPPPAAGARRGNGHGEGLARWFADVDRALWAWLEDDLAPLVLAGSARYLDAYRGVSRYPELLDEAIEEGTAALDASELHARALAIIRDRDADVLGALFAQLSSALSTGSGGTDLHEIARAAVKGRVRVLVFNADAHQWGRLDRSTGELVLQERQRDAVDADVVDDLCEVVLLAGGDVHELPERALPTSVAAIYLA